MSSKVMKVAFLQKAKLFLAVCLLCVSCKQTVVIHEAVLIDEPASKGDLYTFFRMSLLDWSFALWLTIYLLVIVLLWKKGYAVLEWFRKRPLSSIVVLIMLGLTIVFALGSVPHGANDQSFGGWFALPVLAVIFSTAAVFLSIIHRYKFSFNNTTTKKSFPEAVRRRRNLRLLGRVMIWVWCNGWLLYFIAIGCVRRPHVGSEVFWRSAIASLNLFLSNIDSNVMNDIQGHDVLKGLLSCVGFSAVLCTALLIMSLVLFRLMSYLHIRHITLNDERNHLYLFGGMNDASRLLADSIYHEDPHSVIVYLESSASNKSEQEEDKIDGWKNIVHLLTHRRRAFIDAHEDERRALAISNCDICSLEDDVSDVWGTIGAESVKCLIEQLKVVRDAQLHVFFLSEDRETNVQSTAILAKDELIGAKEFQTTIYCHARRNTINRIIEDLGIGTEKRIDVRILDSSHLAIEHLKRNVKNHPISFVSVQKLNEDNPGSVSSDFVSLVMGFGETGQEAVEFLYEYGAFVHKDATQYDSKRSPFSCYVLDNDMEKLEGHFISDIPAVNHVKCNPYRNCRIANLPSKKTDNSLIKFYPFDYRSSEFFTKILDEIVHKLNYVVVAIGDDEQNMTAAVEILRYVRKKRENLDNFCIYVRAYEKGSFKYLNEIAKHYNLRLCKNEKDNTEKIILFGQNEQIYTYDLVVNDRYLKDARKYYETYRSLQIDPNNDEGEWDKRHDDTMKPDKKGKSTKWERMSKIRRKESQDRSNALHAQTKLMLLQEAVGEENVKDMALRALEQRIGKQTGITYPLLSYSENQLMLNLAMCEHLRWNAAHEMMGYVNNDSDEHCCNELTKRHNCLKPWQDLDKESDAVDYIDDYKLFDFGVVETSFKLEYDSMLKTTEKQ